MTQMFNLYLEKICYNKNIIPHSFLHPLLTEILYVFRAYLKKCSELLPPCCQVYSACLIPLSSKHHPQHRIHLKVDKLLNADKNCCFTSFIAILVYDVRKIKEMFW
jgi:hypothetical protein